VILCAHSTLYGILQQHPFTAFGESITLLVQSAVLVGLQWKYNNTPLTEQVTGIGLGLVYAAGIYALLPPEWHFC